MGKGVENETTSFPKYITVTEAQKRYSMCRPTVIKTAESMGALKRFGKNLRIDCEAMDNGTALNFQERRTHGRRS